MSSGSVKILVRVAEIVELNSLVKRFKFERINGEHFPAFSGGSHTIVEMKIGNTRHLNPYSLMSDSADLSAYCISVRRDDEGRGGSKYMHSKVEVGMEMTISNPVNLFALDMRAKKHLMIAGGIGITPFLAQIKQLTAAHERFELHYSVRSSALGAYVDELENKYAKNVNIYYDEQDQKINIKYLLSTQPLGTHLYVCGPKGMINWVRNSADGIGWTQDTIHYEEFLAPTTGKPFSVKLSASNREITVAENESLLEAIESAGVDAPYLCRGGACGQCETDVISADGKFIHHDQWLTDEQKESGQKIMPCVSRFEGKSLVIDR